MKQMQTILDANRYPAVGFNYSNSVYASVLAAGVAEVVTVPTGAKNVIFSATADFYVRFAAAAAIPATEVADGTASILNPQLRSIDGAATIGVISPTTCIVTMEFYA